MSLVDVLLDGDGAGGARLVYGVASDLNTVTLAGSEVAVSLPALSPVVDGDYCAVLVAGADRLILGAVASAPLIQSGTYSGTTGADGVAVSLTFPEPFTVAPVVVATVETSASTQQDTAQINAVNATAVQFRLMRNGGNAGTGQSFDIHWVAVGIPA